MESCSVSEVGDKVASDIDAYQGGVIHLVVRLAGSDVWETSRLLTKYVDDRLELVTKRVDGCLELPMREAVGLPWLGVDGVIVAGHLFKDEDQMREQEACRVLSDLREHIRCGLLNVKTNAPDQPVCAVDTPPQEAAHANSAASEGSVACVPETREELQAVVELFKATHGHGPAIIDVPKELEELLLSWGIGKPDRLFGATLRFGVPVFQLVCAADTPPQEAAV